MSIKFYRKYDPKSEITSATLTQPIVSHYVVMNGIPNATIGQNFTCYLSYKSFIKMIRTGMNEEQEFNHINALQEWNNMDGMQEWKNPDYMQIFNSTEYSVKITLPLEPDVVISASSGMVLITRDHLRIPDELDLKIEFLYRIIEPFSTYKSKQNYDIFLIILAIIGMIILYL